MAKSQDKPAGSAEPVSRVGARPGPWALFVAVITLVLIADLGLKAWSFEHVADTPVRVRTAEAGGPEVLILRPDSEEWAVAHELDPKLDPSIVPRHEPIVVVPELLNLQLTLNTGAVFGTGQGGRPIFITVSIVATIVILILLYRSPSGAWAYQAGLALILGGALGNLYDRVMFSAVRDMLHMLPGTGLWPWIFNPADVALVIGVGLVLLVSWLSERKIAKQKKAELSDGQ